jgi:ribosomal protein S18 acetylase RimI-like enzyme
MNLRRASDSDLTFLGDVFLRAMKPHITKARGSWDEKRELTQFFQQLRLSDTFLIEHDAVAFGFLTAIEQPGQIELHTVCVEPELQGRGLGTAAIQRVPGCARSRGKDVALSVLTVNVDAVSLYERLGFERSGQSGTHYRMRRAAH